MTADEMIGILTVVIGLLMFAAALIIIVGPSAADTLATRGVLNGDTAEEVWNLCSRSCRMTRLTVRGLIEQSNVAMVGTTMTPSILWVAQRRSKADPSIKVVVAPSTVLTRS